MLSRRSLLGTLSLAARGQASWTPLFDGRTTTGWREVTGAPFPACWAIDDGCLRAVPSRQGFQDLRTDAEFEHFECEFAWKLAPGGNSGVKYLVQSTDRWTNAAGLQARGRGLEYQLLDDASGAETEPAKQCGALYGLLAPQPPPRLALDVFHHARLVVSATAIEHWLNGERIVHVDPRAGAVQVLLRQHRKNGAPLTRTPLVLQHHGTPAWFRDLRIRPL
jgi:hypothetical protein